MDTVRDQAGARPDAGQFPALGYLQIGAGGLTIMMSLMALTQALIGHHAIFNPARVFDHASELIDRAIAAYVLLQLTFGWVAGGLQLAAGIVCVRSHPTRLVWIASIVSLANFPHGTVVASFTLLALGRAGPVKRKHPGG